MTIDIRLMTSGDIAGFEGILQKTDGRADDSDYATLCLQEQEEGRRTIFMAFSGGLPAGFVHLVWNPAYAPFRRLGIPEIQDLVVIPSFRRQGIGARLVARCEEEAVRCAKHDIGIGVGLHASYGAAQRLYVRGGYVPDGAGIVYDNVPVKAGEIRPIDDILVLKMVKHLDGRGAC